MMDPAAFRELAQLTLSELRADAGRLFDSHWAIEQRCRFRRLAIALEDAGERQGMADLSRIVRSIAALAAVPRSEAIPLFPELRRKFKELLHRAEGALSVQSASVA